MKNNTASNARHRISATSKKRKAALTSYSALRKQYLLLNPRCAAPVNAPAGHPLRQQCRKTATEIHHIMRRGPNLNNTDSWMPVCRHCHHWIETHAGQSRALGLIRDERTPRIGTEWLMTLER